MTTFYEVWCEDAMEHVVAFPTLKEAKQFRSGLSYPDGAIDKVTVLDIGIRALLCSVFNREGYAAESVRVMGPVPEKT